MSTKVVLVRRVSVERRVTVAVPTGLSPQYLIAALNAKGANEVGEFLIYPDTSSARIEENETNYGDVRWEIEAASDSSLTEALTVGGDSSADALRANATVDAREATAKQRQVLWRLEALNRMVFSRVGDGKYDEARKLITAASLLYELSNEGDCEEAVWSLQFEALIAANAKRRKAAWRLGKLAIEMARRLHNPKRLLLGLCLANIGEAMLNAGDIARAEKVLTEAVLVLDQIEAASSQDATAIAGARAEAVQNLQKAATLTST